ncbi:MAG: UDP-N-acetylglucosamine 2-epimerase (non-hydrolyzing), partial [Anaerolineae bacterium]|nr:UDP-N-acetylglucosamine 2-epimerase (non-hydrolyzing) [Anaerolineae bacterium]
EKPDWVLVYGDTNSTLAGALAAVKLHIPVGHVEAGLRSFNRAMPEEINRVLTDHISTLLFCPTEAAVRNLAKEGLVQGVHRVGDVMYDVLLYNRQLARTKRGFLAQLGVLPEQYALATVHRANNTDNLERLEAILLAFGQLEWPIVFPAHPRTKKAIQRARLTIPQNVLLIEPVGYLEMLQLEVGARCILTDSGGIQKEAYLLRIPCITLREETEWVETVETGWNILAGADTAKIVEAARSFVRPEEHPPLFGDGHAAEKIVSLLLAAEGVGGTG